MAATDATSPREATVYFDGAFSDPRLDHPEGIAVDPRDGSIWCGGEAGQLFRIAPDGSAIEQVATTGGFCLGLAFDHAGGLFVCDQAHAALMRLAPGAAAPVRFADGSGGADGVRLRTPNACAVDAAGNVYVSDSRAQCDPGPGVFRFAPDGSGGLWCREPLHFANGVALAADGRALYVAETWARRVVRIAIEADGDAGALDVVAELPRTLPDGLALAADGALWVACYEPSQLLRIDPDGSVARIAHDPDAHVLCHPTNIAFRNRELLIANLGRWHVSRVAAGVGGVALPLGGVPRVTG
ncbi:MAG: SMP-30/gluconolactonase/LRE family protein [Conexibacter sp.]|nr:SMP-30/gluconolactonase/LRE family protein [Conexibacter sp.]